MILEFKYTESLTEQAFRQAIGYDYFYRESNNLKADDVQTAVVSAKTPHRGTLRRFGYTTLLKPGVYQSTSPLLERIVLLVSNQLEDTIHNAPVKCFASRRMEQRQAFALLQQCRALTFSQRFWWLLNGLWGQFFVERSESMQKEFTPEQITEWGKMWEERFLSHVPVEKRLAGVKPEDILQYYTLDEMLARVKPEDVLAKFTPEEIERYLRTHQRTAS